MIKVSDYTKAYDKTLAVDGLSFDIQPGTILGMVGPNGAGKTTTMRAIAGIIVPTDGQIEVFGFNVVTQPKQAKQIVAFIPDDPKLFDTLSVWEHLQFIAAAYQIQDFRESAESLLEIFELTEKRNALACELSRGMRQKVAICCAYLQRPKVIMFDEPHTGLDQLAIRRMKQTILERAQSGAAVIVSSHLLSLIEDLCTHLLILSKGKSLFLGTLEELRSKNPELASGTSLEEIFFKATTGQTDPSNSGSSETARIENGSAVAIDPADHSTGLVDAAEDPKDEAT